MTDARWIGSSVPYIAPGQGDAWGREAAAQVWHAWHGKHGEHGFPKRAS